MFSETADRVKTVPGILFVVELPDGEEDNEDDCEVVDGFSVVVVVVVVVVVLVVVVVVVVEVVLGFFVGLDFVDVSI